MEKYPAMRKRLRKKKHLKEFQELGFQVEWRFAPPLTLEEIDPFWDGWIDLMEANRLSFGGGGDTVQGSGFITRERRGSSTEQDRSLVNDWLQVQSKITQVNVGPLEDAWYSSNNQFEACKRLLTRNPAEASGPERVIMPPVQQ
jgi:uncharacterized protein YggL (DUF469 family)